jgi:adenylate kinase family enzyme
MINPSASSTDPFPTNNRRIAIVGTTGSGKTTLARQLSGRLGIPHVELDAIRHGPNWKEMPDENFRKCVSRALSGRSWVVDGNYGIVRDLVWPKATILVWLDYPLRVVMWQLFWRTLRRCATREELWNGNQERFWTQFCTKDSLFLWALSTHKRHRRDFPVLLGKPGHAHLKVVHLHSSKATRQWLSGVNTTRR